MKVRLMEAKKFQYSGMLTDGSKKRVRKAIELLVQTSKGRWIDNEVSGRRNWHKLSFITLTISQHKNITGKIAYQEGLTPFLQWLRRTMKVNTYVWKLEIQKRGQIHYHITTPSFIHYQKIRDKWNNIQRANGWLDDYERDYGHSDPNSTDINEVRHIKDLSSYLIKEFCKSVQNPGQDKKKRLDDLKAEDKINEEDYEFEMLKLNVIYKSFGKLWDCSANLKAYGYFQAEMSYKMVMRMNKMIGEKKIENKELEQCTIILPGLQGDEQFYELNQLNDFDTHKNNIRNYKKDT